MARFRSYVALLPSYGAQTGDVFEATALDPLLRVDGGVAPPAQTEGEPVVEQTEGIPAGYQVPIAWRPLVNMGPHRIAFAGEPIVFYAGDSQDRGGLMAGATFAWTASDGWTAAGSRVAHAFAEAGTYTVDCTVAAGGAEGLGTRYVRVYASREDAGSTLTVVGLGPLRSAGAGWTLELELVGDTAEVADWSRVVVYTEQFWGNPTDGAEEEDTLGLDPASVDGMGAPVGRYDAHILFSGLVTGVTTRHAGGGRVAVSCATPEVLLAAAEIFPTAFNSWDTRLNSAGVPERGYVLPDGMGALTAKDVVFQLIAGETNWCRWHDLALFTAEAPIVNAVAAMQVRGTRWGGLTQLLWSEFAVLYCTKKGQAVVRIHPNMLSVPGGQQGAYLQPGEPVLLLDRDVLTAVSVVEAAPNRVAYVKLQGTSSDAKQRSWARSYGAEGSNLPPPAAAGKWERLEGLRTDADPDVDPDAPLRVWADRYFEWRRSRYPKITLELGNAFFLEPYDLVAVAWVSD